MSTMTSVSRDLNIFFEIVNVLVSVNIVKTCEYYQSCVDIIKND